MKRTISVRNIDCANCAAKIEDKINKLKDVKEASLNIMMEKLTIEFNSCSEEDVNVIMKDVEKVIKKVEPDAIIGQ